MGNPPIVRPSASWRISLEQWTRVLMGRMRIHHSQDRNLSIVVGVDMSSLTHARPTLEQWIVRWPTLTICWTAFYRAFISVGFGGTALSMDWANIAIMMKVQHNYWFSSFYADKMLLSFLHLTGIDIDKLLIIITNTICKQVLYAWLQSMTLFSKW